MWEFVAGEFFALLRVVMLFLAEKVFLIRIPRGIADDILPLDDFGIRFLSFLMLRDKLPELPIELASTELAESAVHAGCSREIVDTLIAYFSLL